MAQAADELGRFVSTLRECTAYDLSDYSEASLRRRLRMLLEEEGGLENLLARIRHEPAYGARAVNRITVNTSELFRDPEVWLTLRSRVYPTLRNRSKLNIWHAACSMGQEVYSDMMLLDVLGLLQRARIFASDINSEVLAQAQLGVYRYCLNLSYLDNFDRVINTDPLNYEARPAVPYERYFAVDKACDEIRMHDALRARPMFRCNDLVRTTNPFYIKFDVIFCRNAIIYFNSRLQSRIFEMFYQNLHPGGILVLGAHETMGGMWADRFSRMAQVYVRKDM